MKSQSGAFSLLEENIKEGHRLGDSYGINERLCKFEPRALLQTKSCNALANLPPQRSMLFVVQSKEARSHCRYGLSKAE